MALMTTPVHLAKGEAAEAEKWADGRFWRGQKLRVEIDGEFSRQPGEINPMVK